MPFERNEDSAEEQVNQRVFNRDISAARNMIHLGLAQHRPKEFQRGNQKRKRKNVAESNGGDPPKKRKKLPNGSKRSSVKRTGKENGGCPVKAKKKKPTNEE